MWKADRWFPSSKTCGHCGRVHRGLVLADRVWTCAACGVTHDRDANAAGNLLAAMLQDPSPGSSPERQNASRRLRKTPSGAAAGEAGRISA